MTRFYTQISWLVNALAMSTMALAISISISGCGQTGELRLPEKPTENTTAPATPTPATPEQER